MPMNAFFFVDEKTIICMQINEIKKTNRIDARPLNWLKTPGWIEQMQLEIPTWNMKRERCSGDPLKIDDSIVS